MEATWGQKHLAVLPEDKVERWILGVSNCFPKSDLEVIPQVCLSMNYHEFDLLTYKFLIVL